MLTLILTLTLTLTLPLPKATTLSGHYYQQKFGEDIASPAGQG